MRIDWWTLGLQTVNLLVLLWILGRFLFRPMARIVAERQAATARMLDAAEAERAQSEQARKGAQTERDAAAAARADLLDTARQEADAERASLLEAARQDARAQRADAEAAIAHMRDEEETRIGHRANMLAADIATRLLAGPAARLPVTAFLDGFEQALASLPESVRATIGADGGPVTLSSARALAEDELAACRATILRALGREVAFATAVDPALIAGLRLDTSTALVADSLHDDLDRILAGLNRHDAG